MRASSINSQDSFPFEQIRQMGIARRAFSPARDSEIILLKIVGVYCDRDSRIISRSSKSSSNPRRIVTRRRLPFPFSSFDVGAIRIFISAYLTHRDESARIRVELFERFHPQKLYPQNLAKRKRSPEFFFIATTITRATLSLDAFTERVSCPGERDTSDPSATRTIRSSIFSLTQLIARVRSR